MMLFGCESEREKVDESDFEGVDLGALLELCTQYMEQHVPTR